jgi:hypothetical protein
VGSKLKIHITDMMVSEGSDLSSPTKNIFGKKEYLSAPALDDFSDACYFLSSLILMRKIFKDYINH